MLYNVSVKTSVGYGLEENNLIKYEERCTDCSPDIVSEQWWTGKKSHFYLSVMYRVGLMLLFLPVNCAT